MTAGLLWAGAILVAMGWFAIGWVARGHENRKYAESRLRYFAHEAASRTPAVEDTRRTWPSERLSEPSPVAVHLHLSTPPAQGLPVMSPYPPMVLDAPREHA